MNARAIATAFVILLAAWAVAVALGWPARAEIRAGAWWAWLRQETRWLPIPDAKLIRERNPSGQDAHLCWTPARGVLCFLPPDTGG